MNRFRRDKFSQLDYEKQPNDDARNQLLFDWWCDDGDLEEPGQDFRDSDRLKFIASLEGQPKKVPSRAPLQLDPAPPIDQPPKLGLRHIVLLSSFEHIHQALTSPDFSNQPYAALGGGSFLLGMDPPTAADPTQPDWHGMQAELIKQALDRYDPPFLEALATVSVRQAELGSLAQPDFDLAEFAGQAGLRFMATLFGYGFQDLPLLEEASKATYRALQYLTIGQHFTTEPGTLPAAQQALGRLITRTSELMDEYARLKRSPRRYGPEAMARWPQGVQPWSELDLSKGGEPLLSQLTHLPVPCTQAPAAQDAPALSGKDRATVAATLVAGTLGNIQTAVCLLVQSALPDASRLEEIRRRGHCFDLSPLSNLLETWLSAMPPLPVIPRRSRNKVTLSDNSSYPPGTDFLLLLEGAAPSDHPVFEGSCPRIWGATAARANGQSSACPHAAGKSPPGRSTALPALHACLGRSLARPLIARLVLEVVRLPGLKAALDPLTGHTLRLQRLWGFGVTTYPLRFDRDKLRFQQNLIVSMPIKPPISENAMHLRRLIAAGLPRIDHVLTAFGHVHLAWFEFTEGDRHLVLRTVYDGAFEPYLEYFALHAGDLFDGLFEFLEGGPPRPVREHPREFVETLRHFNHAPVAGYLFSAYPRAKAASLRPHQVPRK